MAKVFLILALFFLNITGVHAKINIYFFTGKGCEYCNEELKYFYDHQDNFADFDIKVYEVWHNDANNKFYQSLKDYYIDAHTIPFTLIGKDFALNGYSKGQGVVILNEAKKNLNNAQYEDIGAKIESEHPGIKALSVKETLINEGIISDKKLSKELAMTISLFIIIIAVCFILIRKAKLI